MKKIIGSFSTRLSLYIITITYVLFVISFYIYFTSVRDAITTEALRRSQCELSDITRRIDETFALAEQSVQTSIAYVEEDLDNPEVMNRHVANIIQSNPVIVGSCVAFEPNFFPQKGKYYMPYAFRDSTNMKTQILGGTDYDYLQMDWYKIPKEQNCDYWSEPYFDKGGGNMIMVTYTQLLRDKQGQMVGVMTADISLKWFSDLVLNMKPYPNSYAFMLSRGGYYLAHKNSDRILNETFFSATKEMTDPTVKIIGQEMAEQKTNSRFFSNDDTLSYVFYMPIERLGWSVALVSSQQDVLSQLNSVTNKIRVIVGVGLVLLFLFTVLIIRRIASPLNSFARSAGLIAQGNFDAPLPEIHTRDEMYALRNAFANMQESLKTHIAELKRTTSAKERMESELSIAHDIQMGMVPKVFPAFPDRCDVDIYAMLNPAKEVGGDLYDFFIVEEKLFFVIGDVSGKGIPASLLMVVACSLFRSTASHTTDPAAIVSTMNNAIAENNDTGMFVTLFAGILNLRTGELNYCNAGHNPPVVLSDGKPANFMSVAANIPIGVFNGFAYQGGQTRLIPGDTFFLYTDGLTEAENHAKELYGEAKLLETLRGNTRNPQELVELISTSVTDHVAGNEQSDDLTMLVIHYKKQQLEKELIIKNEINELHRLAEFVESTGEEWGFSMSLIMSLNLALEEAVSNIILYAYPEKMGEDICIRMGMIEKSLIFTISDTGVEFDPSQVPDADITASAEDRQIGGLGIFLIRKIMDEIHYQRIENKNVLTIKKQL